MDRRERQTLLNRRICGEEDGNVRPACAGGAQTLELTGARRASGLNEMLGKEPA